jgi:hypothetical protein
MRYGIIVSLVVLLTIVSVVVPFTFPFPKVAPAMQDNRHEQSILARAVAATHNAEPEWQYIAAVCNCVSALTREQIGGAFGIWVRSLNVSSDHINVGVHGIATAGAAARLIYRETHRNYGKRWSVTSYELGDGANIATYLDMYRGVTQYTITVRKGRFLASISGNSREVVERFAQFLVTEMSE